MTTDDPELRRDPVTGRCVLVAPERARRPIALSGHGPHARTGGERSPCPFCPGQEADTPDEVFAVRDPATAANGPGWHLRVVPNKFPAVRPDPPSPQTRAAGDAVSLFDAAPATGFAEVVIECREHRDDPAGLSDEQLRDVFRAYRERMTARAADPRLAYVAVFKNVGADAGASLGHTHSQIVALPVVPTLIRDELSGAERYYARTRRCVFCDLVEQELAGGARLVARSERFAVVTAFAPRFAYEMWVLPVRHEHRYESITDAAALELARLLKRVLRALDAAEGAPAYNWFVHTAPLHGGEPPHYHWHLEILPRTARPAGLEWGFGCHITTVAPERAASDLKARLGEP
jgi:UDPglucose--hexose-1-phosphate uridylyltransferase